MKFLAVLICGTMPLGAQTLSAKWEELTAADFEQAQPKMLEI
ncbi:MAG TPA: hypothetical protein VMS37_07215 [Verrucomicrobiae bacterium]|nr:hypothetical protein [Verrucomicrobiae bacterium]